MDSVRGPGGGYNLAHSADQTRIADIMSAVDERLNAMTERDTEGGQGSTEAQLAQALWEQLSAHVHVFLSQTTIADVIENRLVPCPAVPDFISIVDEPEVLHP